MIPMIVVPVAAHTVKLKYAANDKETFSSRLVNVQISFWGDERDPCGVISAVFETV